MKKIINGKRYDTDTAEVVHDWSNGYYCNDFHYCEETLYKTKSGAYFLCGEGGAMSKYSRSLGNNSWGGGAGIEPLTPDEARKWLEDHDGEEALEEYFVSDVVDA